MKGVTGSPRAESLAKAEKVLAVRAADGLGWPALKERFGVGPVKAAQKLLKRRAAA